MGVIQMLLNMAFGSGRNVLRETAEVFTENKEAGAVRSANMQTQAMQQYGAEFMVPRKGLFDRFMDGVNRVPRPALALGTMGLFVAAMVDPIWFAARMQGIALVPEPLWWLLGVIVSFYFGARHQLKAQDFQKDLASTMARAPTVINNIKTLQEMEPDDALPPVTPVSPGVARVEHDVELAAKSVRPSNNPALDAWRQKAA